MSACEEKVLLIGGLIDGELDAVNAAAIEVHIRDCVGCAAEYADALAIRQRLAVPGVAFNAPEDLRHSIERATGTLARPRRRQSSPLGWFAGGAVTAMAASLALFAALPQLSTGGVQDELVASHVRSLLPGHLIDVATSDRHTVKPWFNGKIDFAPPVVDLADRGYPLVGGRLDYIGGHVTPVLIYRRKLHPINVFIRRSPPLASPFSVTLRRDGYALARWADGGLEYWAVSDVAPGDLGAFHTAFAERAAILP